MGRTILISGPNSSGKSAFAESLVRETYGPRYYIATMRCQTEENRRRIEKHRRQRADLGFVTVEEPYSLNDLDLPADSVVLLEDVSNLLANNMFEKDIGPSQVLEDILALSRRCGTLIAVTISGLSEEGYEGETAGYIRALNEVNGKLAEAFGGVAEMRGGRPVWSKGGRHAFA